MNKINKTVLVSGAQYFTDKDAINALMDSSIAVDVNKAIDEHQSIIDAFKTAGIKVIKVDPPEQCQDGIYTANWGLARNGIVVPSRLPNKRKPEEAYARTVFENLGLQVRDLPENIEAFSGQGDSIICEDTVFCQYPYRTVAEAHPLVRDLLGFSRVITLQTKPKRWFKFGPAKRNALTDWPDSPTYDLDLALCMLRPKTDDSPALIGYCPAVFNRSSRRLLNKLPGIDKIKISKSEALECFATNLVSTGEIVIMNNGANNFKAELINRGFKVIELNLPELRKGGGSIRCCSLSLG
jgi:N-dimethylarginine dimethylaminohydrolase